MKGYWIILGSDVTDPEAQRAYGKLWAPIAEKFGAKLKSLDSGAALKEAQTTRRVVVVEFASYERALACYADPAYEEAKQHALKASKRELLIVEGDFA
ncbi:uncharacterized protein (DUF1330 family) [Paraburkholderia sp. JPY465]|uniref:DUF1330 domain-containing protein n=1 Tax=Paraburkholderia sp. JPY465 TaxID=3042285 RepID=UPI003D20A111